MSRRNKNNVRKFVEATNEETLRSLTLGIDEFARVELITNGSIDCWGPLIFRLG